MKYVLDTCSLLWFAQNDSQMSESAFAAIEDASSDTVVSAISFWEISMKAVVGKLTLGLSPSELERLVVDQGIEVLSVTVAHIDRFHQMPVTHRDAFDRLIAAVALSNDMTVITPDTAFDSLGVRRHW